MKILDINLKAGIEYTAPQGHSFLLAATDAPIDIIYKESGTGNTIAALTASGVEAGYQITSPYRNNPKSIIDRIMCYPVLTSAVDQSIKLGIASNGGSGEYSRSFGSVNVTSAIDIDTIAAGNIIETQDTHQGKDVHYGAYMLFANTSSLDVCAQIYNKGADDLLITSLIVELFPYPNDLSGATLFTTLDFEISDYSTNSGTLPDSALNDAICTNPANEGALRHDVLTLANGTMPALDHEIRMNWYRENEICKNAPFILESGKQILMDVANSGQYMLGYKVTAIKI